MRLSIPAFMELWMRFIADHIADFAKSSLVAFSSWMPWELTAQAIQAIEQLQAGLDAEYAVSGNVAVHRTATVESGAALKGPAIVGPGCFLAAGSLVRGGCWLARNCIIGPGSELKSSFLFAGSRLAHFNFVGDSILGADVNLEAGSIIANHRNEIADPTIAILYEGTVIETGAVKFGSVVGDGCRIGANAVLAPGTILPARTIVPRLALIDQRPPE
jgi:NDP-sugar pyrophosphorylase family protein